MEALENSFVQVLTDSDEEADNEDVSEAPDGLLADSVESSDDEDSEGRSKEIDIGKRLSPRSVEPRGDSKPSFVVVDASVNVEDEKKRHFGRHEKKYVLLPYYSQLSIYLDKHFEHIKHGLVASVLVNENRPALRNYIYALRE
nr:unnamed protein product [Haemonchus contortus]